MPVSILILTYDEEANIGDCLASVAWSDDVVVLDSYSTDNTIDIAGSHGARVVQRRFDNYASQRNYGLLQISYRHPWILMLDADERVSTGLRDEILKAVKSVPKDVTMFRLRRRDHLYGRWIRRSSGYPTWFGRLARLGTVTVERPINEEYRTSGAIASLREHLDHFPFNKGFHDWILKHDRYSTMEARLLSCNATKFRCRDIIAADPVRRRRGLKALAYKLPFRPTGVFLALYLLRGGILEGRAGLTFCLLRAWYEFMIDCKCREIRYRANGASI